MMVRQKKSSTKIKLTALRARPYSSPFGAVNSSRAADHGRGGREIRARPGCWWRQHEDGGYVTPYECAGEDATYISRIREDQTIENGLSLWVVSDNLRKGAALNAVQIAELLLNRGLIAAKKAA